MASELEADLRDTGLGQEDRSCFSLPNWIRALTLSLLLKLPSTGPHNLRARLHVHEDSCTVFIENTIENYLSSAHTYHYNVLRK